MKDHTAFSPDALRILTRLSRQIHKLDGYRASLSDKSAVLELIENAAADSRPEVNTIAQELIQSLTSQEQAYLDSNGVDLGDLAPGPSNRRQQGSTHMVHRVYRGQVITQTADQAGPQEAAQERATERPRRHRRVYRGQVIEE